MNFSIELGIELTGFALAAAWFIKTSKVPLWLKILAPAVFVAAACAIPFKLLDILGNPKATSIDALPENSILLAMQPHDNDHKVWLWLQAEGQPPVAYDVAITDKEKDTLRKAQESLKGGQKPSLRVKKGTRKARLLPSMTDLDGDSEGAFVLDEAFSKLPPKE